MTGRAWLAAAAGLLALAVAALANVLQGSGDIPASTVLDALVGRGGGLDASYVYDMRLPRAAAGAVAGAALAGAAVLLQAVTRNPLAEAATLGLTAGAAFAVTAVAAFSGLAPGAPTIAVAFAGVLLATLLIGAIATTGAGEGVRLILAGMATGLAFAAATATIQLVREVETQALFLWGGGSLLQIGWGPVRTGAVVAAVALACAMALSRALDVAQLGEGAARALGLRAVRTRVGAVLLAALLTGAAVGVAGPIAFVGILAAGMARLARPGGTLGQIVVAAPWGAAFLLLADVLGRLLLGSSMETPAGLICAIMGAPVLVIVARRLGDTGPGALEAGRSLARWRPAYALVAVGLVPVLAVASLSLGDVNIAPTEILSTLAGGGTILAEFAIDERAPRLVLALAAGACLAGAGAILQGALRNPFAGPELVGVSGGASVGALVVLLMLPSAPVAALPFAAFAGGVATMLAVLLLSWRRRTSPQTLALVGLAVTAASAAVVSLIVLHRAPAASVAITWMAGSTYAATWEDVRLLLIPAAVLVPASFALIRRLDLLVLDDDLSRGLGLRVGLTRTLSIALGAALASAAVATVGAIAFVGLMAPHAARLITGSNHARLIPMSMVVGSLLLALADVVGRTIAAPTEIPSGLVVALIGAPYLAVLMWRGRMTA